MDDGIKYSYSGFNYRVYMCIFWVDTHDMKTLCCLWHLNEFNMYWQLDKRREGVERMLGETKRRLKRMDKHVTAQ